MGSTNLGDACQWRFRSNELIRGSAQLHNLVLAEWMRPALGVGTVVLGLPDCGTRDFLGEVFVWAEGRIDGRVLTGGLEAIWEEAFLERWGRESVCRGVSDFRNSWCHVGLL